ncbi:unnamed protein product, partial [Owenia fusiformis]
MHVEVSVALNFVISYLYNKLPRRRVDSFGEELEKGLKKKFEGHWYPECPFKGSGFRCFIVSGDKADPVIKEAADEVGLDYDEVKDYLPEDLTIWIDPAEVSYRIGEKGVVKVLYSDRDESSRLDAELQTPGRFGTALESQPKTRGFNPEAQSFKPIDSLSSSMNSLNISPSSPTPPSGWPTPLNMTTPSYNSTSPVSPPGPFKTQQLSPQTQNPLAKSNSTPMITAAMFAQTKFGSTKLKSAAKRPTRLSPTEFNQMRYRSVPTHPSPQSHFNPLHNRAHSLSPRDLSPRDISPRSLRQDFLLDQQLQLQQRFIMQQQQQQQQALQQQNALMNGMIQQGDMFASPPGLQIPDLSPIQQHQPGGLPGLKLGMKSPGLASPSLENNQQGANQLGLGQVGQMSPRETMQYPNNYQHLLLA